MKWLVVFVVSCLVCPGCSANTPAPTTTATATVMVTVTATRSVPVYVTITPAAPTSFLKHRSIEIYIEQNFSETDVVCDDGRDLPIAEGDRYTCVGDDGRTFDVQFTDNSGNYEVTQR